MRAKSTTKYFALEFYILIHMKPQGSTQMKDKLAIFISLGLSLGIGLGVVFGVASDNIGLGMALGSGLGMALGAAAWLAMSSGEKK